MIETNF